eukprot:6705468-Pyramimonas_sp.AAC.1
MAAFQRALLRRDLREHVAGGGAPGVDRAQRRHQLLKHWPPRRRGFCRLRPPIPLASNVSPDLEDSAKNLADYWGE